MIPPNGYDEIRAIYGDPKVRDLGGGQLAVDPQWESAHLVKAELPGYDRKVYMHRLMVEPTQKALEEAIHAAPDYALLVIGCFNPRCKKKIVIDVDGEKHIVYRLDAPSLHTWAIALDINPATNAFGAATYDMPPAFIAAFAAQGFVWGGQFRTPDPMHFQLARGV